MKHLLSILLLFMLSFSSKAQQNLVPNPSFEDTVYCPNATNQIDACQHWLNFGNSPDYFNACDPTGLNVPNSSFGFQYAHSGNGMAGICAYRKPFAPSGPNYREFIGAQLNSPCIIGTKYYVSFYINYADVLGIAINKLGINLSSIQYDSCCKPPLTNSALLYSDSILKDSLLWVRMETSFIADSAYKYLGIGNFFDDANTDTLHLITLYDAAYYYIDDVCITTDSLYNETWTGIPSQNLENLHVDLFPNPANRNVTIMTKEFVNQISIFNLEGVEIASIKNIDELNFQINVSDYKPGLYFVSIKTQSSNTVQKLLIEP